MLGRWQRVLKVSLAEEETIEADEPSSTNFYIVPSIGYSTLPSYIVGGRKRPYFFSAELRGSPETLGSDASFLQLRMKGERIFDMSELWHLHLRSELGLSRIAATSDLPASQRFFAGGEGSVRGFALNELSPKDDEGRTVGGRNLATGTVEVVRDLPRNFGVAAFYDIGNAFDDFNEPDLQYAAGLGVRYNIAVASFGVDVGQALSQPGRSPRFHLVHRDPVLMRTRLILIIVALILLVPVAAIGVLLYSEAGLQMVAAQLWRLERYNVKIEGVSGTLAGPLRIARFELNHPRVHAVANDIVIEPQLRGC